MNVIDKQNQICFMGTNKECDEFIKTQVPNFMYKKVKETSGVENQGRTDKQVEQAGKAFLFTIIGLIIIVLVSIFI